MGTEVADVLDLDPARVFKTLLVDIPDGDAVAIVAAHRQLDLRALSRELSVKRSTMADERTAERVSRSVVGAISPFGLPRRLPTVLDESAADHPTIFVSAGRRGLELELSPDDLVSVLGCRTAPITT